MDRFRQGWIGIIGDVVLAVEALRLLSEWKYAKAIFAVFNIGDAIDFITQHVKHPGWVGSVINFLSHPVVQLLVIVIGLGLIVWDGRRTRGAKQSGTVHLSAIGIVAGSSRPTWVQRVEPYHIIILGLAIALGGVVWQWRRAATPDPRIAQLEAQVESLTKPSPTAVIPNKIAALPQSNSNAPPAVSSTSQTISSEPYYSSGDKERISEALYKLQEILNKKITQVTVQSDQVLSWWEQNKQNRADQRPDIDEWLKRLDAARTLSTEAYRNIFYQGVIEDYQAYADLLRDVLKTTVVEQERPIVAWGMSANNFYNAITTFRSAFVNSDARTREGLGLLINPTQDAFRDATAKLRMWAQECNERIEAKRKALRQ